jgi:glyoxylase-like metal-dependent hydrolase (beta-lactamase superfamily II)
VRAIIYTHSHPDHTCGALVFARTDPLEIYSHQRFGATPDIGRANRDGGDQFGQVTITCAPSRTSARFEAHGLAVPRTGSAVWKR